MAKTRKGKKALSKKHSFILSLALLLAVGYFLISFINSGLENRKKTKEIEQKKAEYAMVQADNERKQAVLDGDEAEKEAYIERAAREKLGYAMPNEKVYHDITPRN